MEYAILVADFATENGLIVDVKSVFLLWERESNEENEIWPEQGDGRPKSVREERVSVDELTRDSHVGRHVTVMLGDGFPFSAASWSNNCIHYQSVCEECKLPNSKRRNLFVSGGYERINTRIYVWIMMTLMRLGYWLSSEKMLSAVVLVKFMMKMRGLLVVLRALFPKMMWQGVVERQK
jgi:hypothetical protein